MGMNKVFRLGEGNITILKRKAAMDMNTDVLDNIFSKPNAFKEQTSDYIDALNQFLEQEQLDILNEQKLEEVMELLTEVIDYL